MATLHQAMTCTAIAAALAGCIAEGEVPYEGTAPYDDELIGEAGEPLVKGKPLKDTALYLSERDATMYQWAARTAPVIRKLPKQAVVRVGNPQDKQGFYQVIHAGTWGWILGTELTERHAPLPDLSARRRDALRLMQSAMGFSYWWSNARRVSTGPTILPVSNKGTCDGNCPKCTHAATGDVEYGADCSGFVSTIWGLPDSDPDTNPDNNGFSTKAYAKANARWATIDLDDALTGDALVRHDDSRKHISMVGTAPDPETGLFATYECMGCAAGCRTDQKNQMDLRGWTTIRRSGWPEN